MGIFQDPGPDFEHETSQSTWLPGWCGSLNVNRPVGWAVPTNTASTRWAQSTLRLLILLWEKEHPTAGALALERMCIGPRPSEQTVLPPRAQPNQRQILGNLSDRRC